MSKITFFIDEAKDRFSVQSSVRVYKDIEKDIVGVDKRTGIPYSLLQKVQEKRSGYEKDLISFVQKKYLQNYNQLESMKEKLSIYFKNNWEDLSRKIEELSGVEVEDYMVHISHFFDLASWYGNTISVPALRGKSFNNNVCSTSFMLVLSHLHHCANDMDYIERFNEQQIHVACCAATHAIMKVLFGEMITEKAILLEEKDYDFMGNLFNNKKSLTEYFELALKYIDENSIERGKVQR